MSRLASVYVGEDVPVTITYEDDSETAVDPDDTGTDGTPDATITISAEDETEVVSAQSMTHNGTGDFEYVWDTSGESEGVYEIAVEAEFSGETKIVKEELRLR